MQKLANHTALKEWAAVISAVRSGDQVILVRKGGIADPAFGVEADRFYLFPTYMHQKEKQFRRAHLQHFEITDRPDTEPETVEIDTWCEVARVWRVTNLDLLRNLPSPEAQARLVTERLAVAWQASLLARFGSPEVATAFVRSRL